VTVETDANADQQEATPYTAKLQYSLTVISRNGVNGLNKSVTHVTKNCKPYIKHTIWMKRNRLKVDFRRSIIVSFIKPYAQLKYSTCTVYTAINCNRLNTLICDTRNRRQSIGPKLDSRPRLEGARYQVPDKAAHAYSALPYPSVAHTFADIITQTPSLPVVTQWTCL